MAEIHATGAHAATSNQYSNGVNFNQAANAAAGIGKVARDRLTHPDAAVIGAAFQRLVNF